MKMRYRIYWRKRQFGDHTHFVPLNIFTKILWFFIYCDKDFEFRHK
jgi:hypothetical protein